MNFSRSNSALFTLEDERVVVLGAGRSGIAAANLAAARGASVRLFDTRKELTLVNLDSRVELITSADERMGEKTFSDYLVISPGINTYGSFVKAFAKNTTELMGELELGYRYYTGTCIGITGTNGKTTTTELVAHLITALGHSALPCGNHGTPLSELILNGAPEYAVVEVSSFQLETISTFRSAVTLWLNLAPDHLDRYPSMDAYRAAKGNIFAPLHPTDWKITRYEEELHFPENHLTFSAFSSEADSSYKNGLLRLPSGNTVDLSQTQLRGLHNVENALAALTAVECLGLTLPTTPETLLCDYRPPQHRCELIRELQGVDYINDSKSTNLHSLETALAAFTQPLILIIGGKEKGLDYTPLKAQLSQHARACITIGEIGEQLCTLFSEVLPCTFSPTLEHAVHTAQKLAEHGDYVLFSPGTSSFDMFTGYTERGNAFRNAVLELV